MNDEQKRGLIAKCIPCHVTENDDYFFSDKWGNKLVQMWAEAKRQFAEEVGTVDDFRLLLKCKIVAELGIEDAFLEGCAEIGIEADTSSDLFYEYEDIHTKEAFSTIPKRLYAEFCWVPEWSGKSLDVLLETHGVCSDRYKSVSLDDVLPDNWLAVFLKTVNCSSDDLVQEAVTERGAMGLVFADRITKNKPPFSVKSDPLRPRLLTPKQVLSAIENSYTLAVPMVHCEINVRALFEMDPTKPMRISTEKRGAVHVGFHEFINGAGYMDTYHGEVVIPPEATGFLGEDRMDYGINQTYGIVRSMFYTTPTDATQPVAPSKRIASSPGMG